MRHPEALFILTNVISVLNGAKIINILPRLFIKVSVLTVDN